MESNNDSPENVPTRSRLNILVVDDDEAMRALLKLHLSNAGYIVEAAEDALSAGRRILSMPPDLLIIDVEMPYLNGIDFVATLLADSTVPYFPVIFLTSHEEFEGRAHALGADFLVKPMLKTELLESVARNMQKHETAEARADVPSVRRDEQKQKECRIVVVEDDLDSVHTTTALLRDLGHTVDYATNGYVALDLVRRVRPDCVLLDIGLPGVEGFDVCTQIRADPQLRNIKVLALTAYSSGEYRDRARSVGFDGYYVKPMETGAFVELFGEPRKVSVA